METVARQDRGSVDNVPQNYFYQDDKKILSKLMEALTKTWLQSSRYDQ